MSLVARPAHAGRRARSAAGPGSGVPGRGRPACRPDTLSRPTRHAAVLGDSAPGADPGAASASRIRRTEHTDPALSTHRSSMKTSAASSHISYVCIHYMRHSSSTDYTRTAPEAELRARSGRGHYTRLSRFPSPTAATAAELRIHTPTCEQSRERTPQTLMDDERTSARVYGIVPCNYHVVYLQVQRRRSSLDGPSRVPRNCPRRGARRRGAHSNPHVPQHEPNRVFTF